MTVTDPRVLLLPTCSRPLFSEAFAAWDPPRSPSLRSGAGVSHAAKAKKTCGANANRFQKEHPGIGYDELMSLNDESRQKKEFWVSDIQDGFLLFVIFLFKDRNFPRASILEREFHDLMTHKAGLR